MRTAEVVEFQGTQAIKLPDDFRFDGRVARISRQGDAVILQPMKREAEWPATFFEDIRIDDQGVSPARPRSDSSSGSSLS